MANLAKRKAAIRQIEKLERQKAALKKKLSALRRAAALGEVQEYAFLSAGGTLRLSQLFGPKEELILIHNMGRQCPYCTLWADGFNGIFSHLADKAAFAVSSPDESEDQQRFSLVRGWKFLMVSCRGNSLNKDLGFEDNKGQPRPGVSVFRKDKKGHVIHVASAGFGPGDDYCAAWSLFDLLSKGAGSWRPQFVYRSLVHGSGNPSERSVLERV